MKKTDYEEYQRKANNLAGCTPAYLTKGMSQFVPTPEQAKQHAENMRNIHVPETWETELEIERTVYAKPSPHINPALIVAIVDAIILGVVLCIAPDFRLIVGAVMTCSALLCMLVVGVGMVRRAGR